MTGSIILKVLLSSQTAGDKIKYKKSNLKLINLLYENNFN